MKPPFIHSWESGGATLSGGMTMLGSGGGMEESSEQVPAVQRSQSRRRHRSRQGSELSSGSGRGERRPSNHNQAPDHRGRRRRRRGDRPRGQGGQLEAASLTAGPAARVAIITTNLASLGLVADPPDESDLIGSSAAPQRGLP